MPFDWNAYAARTGLDHRPAADEAGLFALHHAQFHSIPFENLDIHLGRDIALDPDALVAKLVARRRGGYCFELNGLMLLALRELGYDARPLLARVHLHSPPSGRTHQINAVTLGTSTWIVDVGFGAGGPRQPLRIEDGFEVRDGHWGYRLDQREPWGWLMSSWESGWRESYSFDLGHATPEDIDVANFYTSHSPRTHFTQVRVASRPTEDGRISLRDQVLTRRAGEQEQVETLQEGPATVDLLRAQFGIELDARFEDLRAPVRAG